ncbi:pentapeptide repeat-containing protein [Dictyobacter aurantiacus]|uniref:Oxetanocin A resistance protein n=1 Tax=Dictyobacter aurantiacus TaxID=1936993 RepID=A0A401ZE57_9CHLR|nr:pentapeptide repeat-containing protein [Dictyobacter aurantiacus]GCE05119.1 hypothetical protein KDAU_24480 [Dictyobacter aurantiacus]
MSQPGERIETTHDAEKELLTLRADCQQCFALCCVVPAFAASADFAINKRAGHACPHLQSDFRCGIHTTLRQRGFRGCTVYDCFGAGQKVSRLTFEGHDWRASPQTAQQMFAVFPVMRDLHELLWYVTTALILPAAEPLYADLRHAQSEIKHLTRHSPEELLALDMTAYRQTINTLLVRASELVRAGVRGKKKDHRGADLIGARLKGSDLRGANLRGALLIGADLRNANLKLADLTGADLRDADLRGADLSESIFLIQSQLEAAKGDSKTKLPSSLRYPWHWSNETQ